MRPGQPAALMLTSILALMATFPALADCASQPKPEPRSERMTLRTWASPESPEDYPERKEQALDYLWNRPSFGIAISGGGTRSASAAWGQLRALEHLGWLDLAQYISPVSGGAWAAAPFTFLPPGYCDQKTEDCDLKFLQEYKEPGDLKLKDLEKFGEGSFGWTLSKTQLIRLFLSRLVIRGDEAYSRSLGKRFMNQIQQYEQGCDPPAKHRYFLSGRSQLEGIQERTKDPDLKLKPEDFTFMTPQRPFLVAGSSMLSKKTFAKKDWDFFPLEITPLYVGIPQPMNTAKGVPVGGGYIESPGYDGESYSVDCAEGIDCARVTVERPIKQRVGVRHRYRFTVSDLLGSTGAAPVRLVRSFGLNLIGFPEFTHTPVSIAARDGTKQAPGTAKAKEYAHGDGGHIDNLGLVPLLARKTENILVLVNSASEFREAQVANKCKKKSGQLLKVFEPCWVEKRDGQVASQSDLVPLLRSEGFARITKAFVNLKSDPSGPPLTYCGTFTAVPNERFGIKEYDPKICWIYLDRSDGWIDNLPSNDKIFRKLKKDSSSWFARFRNFPHYGTFFHRALKGRVIDLGEEQVNALAHLTAWAVVESANTVAECFDLPLDHAPSLVREPSKIALAVLNRSKPADDSPACTPADTG